jgi:DNA gyrase subunit B
MRKTLTDLGLSGTELQVRDTEGLAVLRRHTGEELRRVVDLLVKLEELVKVVQRRGIDFGDFLGERDANGRLPLYRIVVEGEEHYFFTAAERDTYLRSENLWVQDETMAEAKGDGKPEAPKNSNGQGDLKRLQKNQELHEVKDLEKLFTQLEAYGLSINDYFLTQEESVSGEVLATKYALVNDQKTVDVASVGQLLNAVFGIAKQGMEIGRFKGLGEMNSEELWETTLDPSKRVLLRVTLEEAGEAERMFSVLMGEDVERRRQFIEEHALEVKNLDV